MESKPSEFVDTLRFTSCMAENMDAVFRRITTYIEARFGIPTEFINHIPWQEREKLFDAEEIQVCWICGLPYVLKAAEPESRIELLAAPVMIGDRYLNRPIYFSDIIVRADSRFQSFADLRGASWVYNEPRSQSGFDIVGHHLKMLGESLTYFGEIIESGAHQTSEAPKHIVRDAYRSRRGVNAAARKNRSVREGRGLRL